MAPWQRPAARTSGSGARRSSRTARASEGPATASTARRRDDAAGARNATDGIEEPPDDREAHLLLKLPAELADQLRARVRADADPNVTLAFTGPRPGTLRLRRR